ncbi:1-phosphofructokinase [Aeromicrobium marinum DSM 15272]|uniref:1-phosphofructokinase n=1 Tax=Aeromicrobium marinum DSM 15272 TaxID=585531 RepID=E2SB94_9ACTN|nr:1-phosphofructokinase family hexose kinase [Aeromicrobium marinum]EFQ83640.1 1-phosphofructokinase [Aeromicrobium marinum DSM 15272]
MIVTLTPNPSIDRTVTLAGALERGGVVRSTSTVDEPGGKGVNVAQVVRLAGHRAVAVLPGDHDDPLLRLLRELGLPHRTVATGSPARVNLTLTEADGTTTKINAPGPALATEHHRALIRDVAREASGARWAVLCGSLPPGVHPGYYADVVDRVDGARIALDTSGPALAAALERCADRIAVIKPNAHELGELLGVPSTILEEDPSRAHRLVQPLLDRGLGEVLLTLGSRGALLLTADGAWSAAPPPVTPRSTVGAGDSALAGYLIADLMGRGPAERLASAVAHGSAAASLPGSRMPGPDDLPDVPPAQRLV